jgi:hypothetical protein
MNMNIDEIIIIFKIPPQVDKHFNVHYAKSHKHPSNVLMLSTYDCTQTKVRKKNSTCVDKLKNIYNWV